MLSPKLRNKIHGLWTMFWSAGMTNPLVAIEQITYLLFLRQLEHFDQQRVKSGKPTIFYIDYEQNKRGRKRQNRKIKNDYTKCKWSHIRKDPSFTLLNETVFPWLRNLEKWLKANNPSNHDPLEKISGRLDDAYFILDTNKVDTLKRAVEEIDDLFTQLDSRSANADIMGDIFEYLLSEIQSAGKNGQFRTPRHIIRFMVEMLDPPVGSNILDPACGTGGFLVNTLLHWKKQATDPQTLRIEWDGTPHRTFGTLPDGLDLNNCFYGYDNDRTMVRIAWMNLILHDLDFPNIEQLDALSKRMDEKSLSNKFDFILANPPFTGSVDEGDLSTNRRRFPASGNKNKPITTKSELLFVWLMLDLLRIGGRCAVVVPDGVLFGSTKAHIELRRQLLFEHTLEGVVSLPGGVFQPYAGVKTSILIFQKAKSSDDDTAIVPGDPPRTHEVWFYEVNDEAYTLDQKRKDRLYQNNDLYDAVEKFQSWHKVLQGTDMPNQRDQAVTTAYHQPEYWQERWRVLDEDFLHVFPNEKSQAGHALGIQEVFSELNRDPKDATAQVCADGEKLIVKAYERLVKATLAASWSKDKSKNKTLQTAKTDLDRRLRQFRNELIKLSRSKRILDHEFDQFALIALRDTLDTTALGAQAKLAKAFKGITTKPRKPILETVPQKQMLVILKCFARLDGYNLLLRSVKSERRDRKDADAQKDVQQLAWITPVRAWAQLDSWGKDPKTGKEIRKPTHNANGEVDLKYLKFLTEQLKIFEKDGTVKLDYRDRLDPDCIEAADLNLSAGRYKPFVFEPGDYEKPAALIKQLDKVHADIRSKLKNLLDMVGNAG